ncbi:hypothetical protein FDECE_9612 [Fusarium decemcellulare]|nr:hypothetical protein FDECE_9612 [Fusarium decemcellulare]
MISLQLTPAMCGGYDHDLIFRDPLVSTSYPSRPKAKRQPRGARAENRDTKDAGPSSSQVSSRNTEEFPLITSLAWPLLDIISLVVQNFTPVGESPQFVPPQSSVVSHRICGGWIGILPELARETRADEFLSPAVKALAVSVLARGRDGRAPMADALAAHNLAMASLHEGLGGWAASAPNTVAAAIMCLFLSEMIMPTSPESAIVHAKGMDDLMQLQGPAFYASGLSHHMFVGFRPVLVLQAFVSRRKHFLSEPRWTSIPYSIYAASPLQELFTEAFPLTGIMERMDALEGIPMVEAIPDAQQILEEILGVFQRIVHRDEILKGEITAYRWLPIFPVQHDLPIRFPDISAANFFTHVWAFEMICADHIVKLLTRYPCLSMSDAARTPGELPSIEMIKHLACWCFRSIEFLIQKEFKLFGAASTSLVLKTACDMFRTYGHDDPDLVFWHSRVSGIITGGGYAYLERLLNDED